MFVLASVFGGNAGPTGNALIPKIEFRGRDKEEDDKAS
jgi:hypothetical protein